METTITTATAAEEAAVVSAVVMGFSTDPVARWAYPDPQQYLDCFPAFVRAFGGKAFAHGSAHYTGGFRGAALWLPPDVGPDEEALMTTVRWTVPEPVLPDLLALMERMGASHPSGPHWYLPMIAVDTAFQGQGHGSALLKHALAICDREGVPAYLESSNPRNLSLYRRHGFEQTGLIQAGSSPPVYPMLRKPR